ncbi:MAG: SGNH/GDSL hydrolase family protein [Flavobacteriaceae bacterium]
MTSRRVKQLSIFIGLFLIGFQMKGNAQTVYEIPSHVKRIVFLGNSITYSGEYVSYIEAYLTIRYPEKHIEFINIGLPSETVSGLSEANHAGGQFPRPDLHERLERALTQLKPDLIFACYGMNDGIYLPFDEIRFQQYRKGIQWLHNQAIKSGIPIVHLTPPVFDERKGKAYANVLDIYSDWLIRCRKSKKWDVIDIHGPMKKHLEDERLVDSTFAYAKDGVHPNKLGHWIIAKQVLLFLGENEVSKAKDSNEALFSFSNAKKIVKLIEERQKIMKDSWLTYIGHKRPGMNLGLPLNKAQEKSEVLEKQIRTLMRK